MTDHRRIQRTLFRMQADPGFARAVYAREAQALASTGLHTCDVDLLTATDPAGVAADPGGRRRQQIFGNAASEFTLTLAAAGRRADGAALLDGFLSCDEFHRAMAQEGRLPLAFAAFAKRRVAGSEAREVAAVLALESAMTELRRATFEDAPIAGDALCLAPRARTLQLAAGTLDWASELRAALDSGCAAPAGTLRWGEHETALLLAQPEPTGYQLPQIGVELVSEPADEFLRMAAKPASATVRAAFAVRCGASPQDFERYLDGLVDDGVLVRCQ